MRPRLVAAALVAALLDCNACRENGPSEAPDASSVRPPPPVASASAAAPAPPHAVDGALPAGAPRALDRVANCAKDTCTLTHVVPDEVRPALSDGAPMVIWDQTIGERASLVFPRDEPVEVMGVVLDGSLDLTAMEASSARAVGERWTAFRAPGGGLTLTGTGGKAARVALVVAVAERGTSLGAHLDQRDRPGAPPAWAWKARRKRVDTFSFAARPDLAWGGGAYHARIGWEATDEPAAVMDLVRFSADAGVAEHVHEHEWEGLALLEGDGVLARKGPAGGANAEVYAGAIVMIPAGTPHAWKPSGRTPVFAIQVYAPPGPEQRYRKLSAKAP